MYDPNVHPIVLDVESCGFSGPITLIQYSTGGPITLYEPWFETVADTMNLIESFTTHSGGVVGFNLVFDWFKICQLWTTLALLDDPNALLKDCVEEFALAEPDARDGPCLKPVAALDLMLTARKGEFQITLDRSDIRIRRVPTPLARPLALELEKRVELDDVLFARRKDKTAAKWKVFDVEDEFNDKDPDFKDVGLIFAPSGSLKALAKAALGVKEDDILLFSEIEPKIFPVENDFAPYALSVGRPGNWAGAWPDCIEHHWDHWRYNSLARKYAEKDVEYTLGLYDYFGRPNLGDYDSELACMVAAVRWRGFKIDLEGIKRLRDESKARIELAPKCPRRAKAYLMEALGPAEQLALKSTAKPALIEIARDLEGTEVAKRAEAILDARQAAYETNFFDKLLLAGRLHADIKVIGTLSGRMAGAGGLNVHGIKRSKDVRSCFPLAWDGEILSGGDFDSFEVALASAAYDDPDLHKDLTSGKKIHGVFGQCVYPGMTYEEILADKEKYTRSKSAVFAMLYGGEAHTLMERLGVSKDVAENAFNEFGKRYPGVARSRRNFINRFCTLEQAGGIGSRISWKDPDDYVESMLGFRRDFTLENRITKALFTLATNPPPAWRQYRGKVERRVGREQTSSGATMSALYGAAFALQAANCRAAANHQIQSSGAQITKMVQHEIWKVQPSGIHPWKVTPLSVHDEILVASSPDVVDRVAKIVESNVESFRPLVPLITMEWKIGMKNWSEK